MNCSKSVATWLWRLIYITPREEKYSIRLEKRQQINISNEKGKKKSIRAKMNHL